MPLPCPASVPALVEVGPRVPPPTGLAPPSPAPVRAPGPGPEWTGTDRALEATFWTLFAVDWLQTLEVARHPTWRVPLPASLAVGSDGSLVTLPPRMVLLDRYTERNPLLGRHPSPQRVHAYFLAAGTTYCLATRRWFRPWRRTLVLTAITLEAFSVHGNIQAGIRLH